MDDNKRLAIEQSLVEAQADLDEALAKATFLESKHKHLAQSVVDDANERLSQDLFENEGLCAELASLKDRFIQTKRMMGLEWNQWVVVQWDLAEVKVWWAREDKRVKVAKEEALKEAKLQWQAEVAGQGDQLDSQNQ